MLLYHQIENSDCFHFQLSYIHDNIPCSNLLPEKILFCLDYFHTDVVNAV